MLVCAQCSKVYVEPGLDRCPKDGSPLYEVGAASPDDLTLAPGAVVAGKFELLNELQRRSGAGRTWIAHQTALKRHVELRVLPRDCVRGPADTARFQREVSTWGRLRSDHLARLFDSGIAPDGSPYMALEIIEGGLAGERLAASGPLPWSEWREVAEQALEGLRVAHEAGVLHRDLSPDALVIGKRADGGPHVRLTGFGLAKLLAGGDDDPTAITSTGLFMGNPAYMAPEWMMKAIVGPQTDLFALGITLYELACGARPVKVTNNSEALAAYVLGTPTPLVRHRTDTPPGVTAFMAKLIAFDPQVRFASAELALASLREVDFEAREAPAPEAPIRAVAIRSGSPVKSGLSDRNRLFLAIAGTIVAGALLGYILSL